ncbi:hypothetical protein ABTD28_19740, partial [Acinetobacter baumannii]
PIIRTDDLIGAVKDGTLEPKFGFNAGAGPPLCSQFYMSADSAVFAADSDCVDFTRPDRPPKQSTLIAFTHGVRSTIPVAGLGFGQPPVVLE